MTDYYVDTDGGTDGGSDGLSWANADASLSYSLTNRVAAGDRIFMQGAANDSATSHTLTPAGSSITNPVTVIAVKDGTTNTGSSIVTSDLVDRASANLVTILATAGAITFGAGTITYYGFEFRAQGSGNHCRCQAGSANQNFIDCILASDAADFLWSNGWSGEVRLINCEVDLSVGTTSDMVISAAASVPSLFEMCGGLVSFNASAPQMIRQAAHGQARFIGVDISGFPSGSALSTNGEGKVVLQNCKMPATYTLLTGSYTYKNAYIELIACASGASKPNTDSYQDYEWDGPAGNIVEETTRFRTGGADDGASGDFAYAMTPVANGVKEGSNAALISPWLEVWVPGGASKTITVYIANSSASTDYQEDEVFLEAYTPDAGDSAQHDQNFDPNLARLLNSTTNITDDTGSTWGSGANNHQKLSVTVTPGFEGWVHLRVHLLKRQASPDTLYLDPLPEVT